MVVLVDDRDGARVQVDPEEVWPHLHAALQPVALLDSSQLAVHSIHTHCTCCRESFQSGGRCCVWPNIFFVISLKECFLRAFLTWALRLGTGVIINFSEDLPSLETKRTLNCLFYNKLHCYASTVELNIAESSPISTLRPDQTKWKWWHKLQRHNSQSGTAFWEAICHIAYFKTSLTVKLVNSVMIWSLFISKKLW